MTRIAINGLGRIGRIVFRLLHEHPEVEVVAVNDLAPNEMLAHLLKYDTAYRPWRRRVEASDDHIIIDGHAIECSTIASFSELPWKRHAVDIVIECTGVARKRDKAMEHITAGAGRVIISSPADKLTKTVVMGVNDEILTPDDIVISNASCTTNCLAPMARIMRDEFGLESAIMSTVHAYTADQNLQDGIHEKDYRRARAAAMNITPTSSNATKTLELIMPEMKGKFIGGAMRVPVLVGSLTELYCQLGQPSSVEAVNAAFKEAAEGKYKGIIQYTEDPIVSSDIVGNPYSTIFDSKLTAFVNERFCKIVGWYDNECGYSNRLVDLVLKVANL